MARQTRQERRARRAQQEPALAGGPPSAPPGRPTANGGSSEPRRPGGGRPRPTSVEERRGSGPIHFVQESIAELKKVEWPDQKAVVSGTAVVLIACIIVGAFLWLNDEVWKYVVQHVLLR
jgi:preprotein translocase SecE subunit